jgi:DNA topoisomerase-1
MDGNLLLEIKSQAESELRSSISNLRPEEAAVLAMLRGRLAKEAERPVSFTANVRRQRGSRLASSKGP